MADTTTNDVKRVVSDEDRCLNKMAHLLRQTCCCMSLRENSPIAGGKYDRKNTSSSIRIYKHNRSVKNNCEIIILHDDARQLRHLAKIRFRHRHGRNIIVVHKGNAYISVELEISLDTYENNIPKTHFHASSHA
jgi:hypothetical protein